MFLHAIYKIVLLNFQELVHCRLKLQSYYKLCQKNLKENLKGKQFQDVTHIERFFSQEQMNIKHLKTLRLIIFN